MLTAHYSPLTTHHSPVQFHPEIDALGPEIGRSFLEGRQQRTPRRTVAGQQARIDVDVYLVPRTHYPAEVNHVVTDIGPPVVREVIADLEAALRQNREVVLR